MPHLVILYTPNLERETDMTALCRSLADTMLGVHDDHDRQVFPTGGTRVLAYPAAHSAVADGREDYAFVYLNLRMAQGRPDAIHKKVGDALLMTTKTHFQPVFRHRHIGITLQIDEGLEVFDARHSNLHPLFNKT
ncbi:MAG: 5-carboxymethyl-2-hydroxymuconate Delta-isomerase [Rhodoferax sp.]|jgi:5-carboxymethyl-2-hydroxymuconate isomerase|nr:5-carboxymethyl-2-hydroxymuconate Delta-isomerase [Rhodoferax sp.]